MFHPLNLTDSPDSYCAGLGPPESTESLTTEPEPAATGGSASTRMTFVNAETLTPAAREGFKGPCDGPVPLGVDVGWHVGRGWAAFAPSGPQPRDWPRLWLPTRRGWPGGRIRSCFRAPRRSRQPPYQGGRATVGTAWQSHGLSPCCRALALRRSHL